MGYLEAGNDYYGLTEQGRAIEYYNRAFQLREHASELESLHITAFYYESVTGELEKAAQILSGGGLLKTTPAIIEPIPRSG